MQQDAHDALSVVPGALLPRAKHLTSYKDPFRFDNPAMFKALMLESLMHNASDIFIQPGLPICARINGTMMALTNRPLDDGEVKHILKWAAGRDTAETDIVSGRAVNARYELSTPSRRMHAGRESATATG
ncbi:hypothetical protein [Aeromonas veronii]|uniref:hypothetical protein n=1 Tax=Aeromonas veronii TaxID=654 RepID=UPI001F0B3DBF|nr:hypothetical protein [Aeromonas veronii]